MSSKFTKNIKNTTTNDVADLDSDNEIQEVKPKTSKTKSITKPKSTSKSEKTEKKEKKEKPKADFINNPTNKIQVPSSDYDTLTQIYKHQNLTYPVSTLFNPYCTKETASKILVYEGTLGDCDFMIFDNKVFSVKLYYAGTDKKKAKDIQQSEKLIMVNLDEIDQLYEIKGSSLSHQTAFKRFYNNKPAKPIDKKKSKEATKAPASKVFNTSKYPLTDNTGKWISVCYLIPYLFMSSSKFVELYSNQLFTYILSTDLKEMNKIIDKPLSVLPPLRETIGSYDKIKASLVSAKKIKSNKDSSENSENEKSKDSKTKVQRGNTECFLLYSKLQPIIPRLLTDDSVQQSNLENYMKKYKITKDNITSKDISTVKAFYNSLNKLLYNPTDITVINQIMRIENETYPETVKIIKIDKTKFNKTKNGIKYDESVLNEYKGIKEVQKKNKSNENKLNYTSQEHFEIELSEIPENTKLKDVCEYIITTLKKDLSISKEDLKSIKASYPFNHDDYELIVSTLSSENYTKYITLQKTKTNNIKDSKKSSPVKTTITLKLNNIQEIQDSNDGDEDEENDKNEEEDDKDENEEKEIEEEDENEEKEEEDEELDELDE